LPLQRTKALSAGRLSTSTGSRTAMLNRPPTRKISA
jgi:hypothetical protein